jgi:hypothetical protein
LSGVEDLYAEPQRRIAETHGKVGAGLCQWSEIDAASTRLPNVGKGEVIEYQRLNAVAEIEIPLDDGPRRIPRAGIDG